MNDRIRQIRKILHLSQNDFAAQIGLTQNAVSYMEKNGATVKEYHIKTICRQFHVNETWLRSGRGSTFLEPDPGEAEIRAIFAQLSPKLQEHLIKDARNLLDVQAKTALAAPRQTPDARRGQPDAQAKTVLATTREGGTTWSLTKILT